MDGAETTKLFPLERGGKIIDGLLLMGFCCNMLYHSQIHSPLLHSGKQSIPGAVGGGGQTADPLEMGNGTKSERIGKKVCMEINDHIKSLRLNGINVLSLQRPLPEKSLPQQAMSLKNHRDFCFVSAHLL